MTETQITQADRDAYAAALEKMKYARSADAVRNGFEDKHPIVQAFAKHRTTRTDATPVAWMPIAAETDAELVANIINTFANNIYTASDFDCQMDYSKEFQAALTWYKKERAKNAEQVVIAQVDAIRAQPYPTDDDYIEVRRDERERIISLLYTHPPATDVAALVEAAKAMFNMPGDIDIESNPPELQREALDVRRQAWNALRSALAPFTKGQP